MLEYGDSGKRAFQGWKQSGKNLQRSNDKLNEANKNFTKAIKGLGVASIDPMIDVSESISKINNHEE